MKNSGGNVVSRLVSKYSLPNLSLCGNSFGGNSVNWFAFKPTSFKLVKL